MNKRTLERLETSLLQFESILGNNIRTIKEDSSSKTEGENPGNFSGPIETVTGYLEEETTLSIAQHESGTLDDVTDAIKRLRNGSYGICERCRIEIPYGRLEVIPYARMCISCQKESEKSVAT